MNTYEAGFCAGEMRAFEDRKGCFPPRLQEHAPRNAYEVGFWDGYRPRTGDWWQAKYVMKDYNFAPRRQG